MKKKTITIFIFSISVLMLLNTNALKAQDREINFAHENFNELLAKAKKEKKLIFMDCWATWCGPCIQMAKTAFKDNKAADFYNSTFVNAKFDMEKGEGIELKNKYNVTVYPTLLFIDGDGKVVHRSAGGRDAEGILKLAEIALNPDERLSYFTDNFAANKTNAPFVARYLNALKDAYLPYEEIAAEFFNNMNQEKYLIPENWEMIKTYADDFNSNIFKFLVANKEEFTQKYGNEEVNTKIENVYFSSQAKFLSRNLNEEKYNTNKALILAQNNDQAIRAITHTDIYFYQIKGDFKNFVKKANELIIDLKYDDQQQINSLAWAVFEQSSDTEDLQKALKWSEISVKLEKDPSYIDTLANLHFKLGNKEKAIELEKEALELAKNYGMETSGYEETLNSFQK